LPLLFLAIIIGIPFLEISVFVEVGGKIGALNTAILTILTAIAGMALLRHQGLSVLMQAQNNLNAGKSPIREILSGIMLALAGLFLLIPGFVTDGIGFLLFLPPLRNFLAGRLAQNSRFMNGRDSYSVHPGARPQDTTIIEGEFSVIEDMDADAQIKPGNHPNEDSPWSKNRDNN